MSLWFTASAVSPQLAELWGLTASQTGWLTTTVQLGFVAGTAFAAALNLADLVPDRPYFAASALLGAAANAAILLVPGYEGALVLRFLTGFFLAGVYPPAMKMIATWFRTGRGLAIGTIVGALTIGKAAPYLVSAFGEASVPFVVLTASAGAVIAAGLVLAAYRPGPYVFDRRPFSWRLVGTVLAHRPTRLAIGGYLGHMWELYAVWTALGSFFLAFFLVRDHPSAVVAAGSVTFAVIAAGGLGAVGAGLAADRWGREEVASAAMALSGLCSLTVGWLIEAPALLVIPLAILWGTTVVADSAQFSALVTEVAPRHAVGTALTLQTALGFGLTAVSIWLVFAVSSAYGWGPAFSLLAIGPASGIVIMLRLRQGRGGGAPAPAGAATAQVAAP
ncbi:MAG: MFS transporter [Gemmatimonadetes bacterium]|nr:MFS transporter [Gemmatimonadota bacterium]